MASIIHTDDYFVKHEAGIPFEYEWVAYCNAWKEMRGVPAPYTEASFALGCKCEGVNSHEVMKDCPLHTFEDSEKILAFIGGNYDEAA
jgi:hypothetical protein